MAKFTLFCAGMSRSGGTLQYLFAKEVLERAGMKWDIIKREWPEEWMIDYIKNGRGMAINIYRDPRDVLVSLWEFYERRDCYEGRDVEWDFYRAFQEFTNTMTWQLKWESRVENLHSYRYEDYHPYNWHKHVIELQRLLTEKSDNKDAHEIADLYNLDRNIARSNEINNWWDAPGTLLTARHISDKRGAVGRYTDVLDMDQIKVIENYAGNWMRRNGYL